MTKLPWCFHQHLKAGRTASVAVNHSIISLCESEEFSEMSYWAPFQLIGEDVKMIMRSKNERVKCSSIFLFCQEQLASQPGNLIKFFYCFDKTTIM